MLASAVFAFETTLQPVGLLPLLGGCAAAYLASSLLMRHSIMTEKIARRGVRTPAEYLADPLEQVLVTAVATPEVVTLPADDTVGQARGWIASGAPGTEHQGFPVVDPRGTLVGLITRRDLADASLPDDRRVADAVRHAVRFVYDDGTVRQAADHMVNHAIGRLPVVSRDRPHRLVGILTRSDVLSGYRRRVREANLQDPTLRFRSPVVVMIDDGR
jgi:CBS domain-containing protein